ncbi:unnamed protein product [Bemisia tabaci]|uniref:Uncharacterized protein n=1 Tax=Bemisia tabaci TaxID=7038 RepID=A0A9P0AJ99_BEMTA|nr:unnamed protein product [Bemisia tabaci]
MEQADQQYFDDEFDPRCLFSDDVCDPSGSDSVGPLDRILNAHCDDGAESDSDLESVPGQFVLTVQDILCNWTVEQKVEHSKVTALLQSLESVPLLSALPSTARSLVKTPRKYHVKDVRGSGKYLHVDDFIDEAKALIKDGIEVNGQFFTVSITGFAGDAPAKALVLEFKHCNGKSGCTRCNVRGEWSEKSSRTYYDNDNAAPRTHEEFLSQSSDDDYHRGTTRLTDISTLSLPKSFSLDYLHLLPLGCFRTLVYLWIFGKKEENIGAAARRALYEKSAQMRPHAPGAFCRKPRTLQEAHYFKDTE